MKHRVRGIWRERKSVPKAECSQTPASPCRLETLSQETGLSSSTRYDSRVYAATGLLCDKACEWSGRDKGQEIIGDVVSKP